MVDDGDVLELGEVRNSSGHGQVDPNGHGHEHPHSEHEGPGTLGSAIAAFVLGVAAAALLLPAPGIAFALGVAAMTAGLVSRRRLMTGSAVNGSRLSLAGILLGCAVVLLAGLQFAVPYLLIAFALFTP